MDSEIKYGPKSSEFDRMLEQYLQHRRDGMQAQLDADAAYAFDYWPADYSNRARDCG